MKSIKTLHSAVHFNEEAYNKLNTFLFESKPSKLILLVDTNTKAHCLEKFLSKLVYHDKVEVIQVEAGEQYKTIETCLSIWQELTELGSDRKSLLINLGGGVITDMGGFAASTFRRGIHYINVPTSLLAMVDASVGGKTGVDLSNLKNQIGVINSGEMVLVDSAYLETLPENHFRSGISEMLKHGLIADRTYWEEMKTMDYDNLAQLDNMIHRSIEIKNTIVSQDPNENGIRKTLNFGHTLGHAIESAFLDQAAEEGYLHGEAIAIGMILESYISSKILGLPEIDLEDITNTFNRIFQHSEIIEEQQLAVLDLMKYDKKNEHGRINYVLLEEIGKPKIDCTVKTRLVMEAFEYYNSLP